jgi:DNA-binding XRE family transcriptional regulator
MAVAELAMDRWTDLAELVRAFSETTPLRELPPPAERRRLRRAAGVTLPLAAAVLSVAQGTVSRWENGVGEPVATHANAYRRFLGACQLMVDGRGAAVND